MLAVFSLALMLAAALPLTACTQSSSDAQENNSSASAVEDGAYPVTIKHAFGGTTIDKEPTRILTLDSAAADTVIALGVTPIAMQKDSWAGDADGFLPWTRAELEKSGQTLPTPAMRAGDFSAYAGTPIYDPLTGNPDGTGRTPFAGNAIPTNRIDPASEKTCERAQHHSQQQAGQLE